MNAEHITPPPEDNVLTVRKEDFEDLLDRAAEQAARAIEMRESIKPK